MGLGLFPFYLKICTRACARLCRASLAVTVLFCLSFSSSTLAQAIHFNIDAPSDKHIADLKLLKRAGVFDRLNNFLAQNFSLAQPITLVIHRGDGPYYNPGRREVVVPFSFLDQASLAINNKYPMQDEVQQKLFTATIEQMLWHEFARAIVTEFSLPLLGREEINIDYFVTLMMLNLRGPEYAYILDAVEDYLVLENALVVLNDNRFKSELELDLYRYRIMTCMVLGKDNEQYPRLLGDTSWDQPRLDNCQRQYESKLQEWLQVLEPHLKSSSPIRNWLRVGTFPGFEEQTGETSSANSGLGNDLLN